MYLWVGHKTHRLGWVFDPLDTTYVLGCRHMGYKPKNPLRSLAIAISDISDIGLALYEPGDKFCPDSPSLSSAPAYLLLKFMALIFDSFIP